MSTRRYWIDQGFTHPQVEQLWLGEHHDGIDPGLYANRRLSAAQMFEIRKGLAQGIDMRPVINPAWDTRELIILRSMLEQGLDVSELEPGSYDVFQLFAIREALLNGIAVSELPASMDGHKMWAAIQNRVAQGEQ